DDSLGALNQLTFRPDELEAIDRLGADAGV
ncbi:MAG: hypothetical protein QOC60_1057, partial [Frankiaceae bacterium]|nr:hypothetical protein [Frankiaceae bacterium]